MKLEQLTYWAFKSIREVEISHHLSHVANQMLKTALYCKSC